MEEALEIFDQLGEVKGQVRCLNQLVWLFLYRLQIGASGKTALRVVDLLSEKGQELPVCDLHQTLGITYQYEGENEKAIHHFETALRLASTYNGRDEQFWIHHHLANLFYKEEDFVNADAHIEQANSHAIDYAHKRGCAMQMQTKVRFSPSPPASHVLFPY